jgi:hypothetical protein
MTILERKGRIKRIKNIEAKINEETASRANKMAKED